MLRKHKKLTKKELKKDPLLIFTAQILDFLRAEWIKIASTVLVVVFVITVATFMLKGRKKSEINAYDAALTALQNNAPEASDLLKSVADKYSGSTYAADAMLRLGNLYFQQKDYDTSEKYFKRYIDKFAGDPLSDFNAYKGLGVVLEEKGDYTNAASTYEEFVSKHKNSPFTSMMHNAAAKAYWLAGDKESAKRYFSIVAEQPKDSDEKQEAIYYLEMLALNKIN